MVLFAVLALGIALFGCGSSTPSSNKARPSRTAEQARPEPSSTSSAAGADRSTDKAWATAISRESSPGLATPDEIPEFNHRIALTFDDGPDPTTTPAILDILRSYGLKATFFVIGARAQQHPELIRRIVSEGHTLGNHTYYHRDMTRLPSDSMLKELRNTQTVIDQALGSHSRLTLFRPPCGAPYNVETDRLAMFQRFMRERRVYPVMWNIDPRDWSFEDQPGSVVNSVVQNTPQDGGVVLLHDTQPQTVDALPGILDYYSAANFEFTGVRELLAEKYGVDPAGIEATPDAPRPGTTRPVVPGKNAPDSLDSLAECLTY